MWLLHTSRESRGQSHRVWGGEERGPQGLWSGGLVGTRKGDPVFGARTEINGHILKTKFSEDRKFCSFKKFVRVL